MHQRVRILTSSGCANNFPGTQYELLTYRAQAIRGAGPSFGIITHFYFQTYEAPAQPTFFSYSWSLPLQQAIEGISTYQNFSFSSSIPSEVGFELDLTKGTNPGEINLHLVGSHYGSPDHFSAIIQPFLDAMVRTDFYATDPPGLSSWSSTAQPDVTCTGQCNLMAGQFGNPRWRPACKHTGEHCHRRQSILREESHDTFGSSDVTGGHYGYGELDVGRGMVYEHCGWPAYCPIVPHG